MPSSPSSSPLPRPGSRAALSASLAPISSPETGAMGQRLEFSARGERVAARLLTPREGQSPFPLAIFIHDDAGASPTPALGRHLATGTATLDMNWPLTGSRRSPKMSIQLLAALASHGKSAAHSVLLEQFRSQAEEEFACLLEAGGDLREIASRQIVGLDFCLTPERATTTDSGHELFAPLGEPLHWGGGSSGDALSEAKAQEALTAFLDALLVRKRRDTLAGI